MARSSKTFLAQLSEPKPPTSRGRTILRVILGAFLVFAGIGHLTFGRGEFQAQVPDSLPLSADQVVVASGVVEITLGGALALLAKRRVPVGWAVALLFIAVFPGNISQWLNARDGFGLDTDTKRFVRLFFQPVLVLAALWSTGAWRDRPRRKR
ncbi:MULTISPECIES: DoxX family membrane protein [unclassified Leucobacter]|uniref:DoxX family protein n=1 Tax=unclassified Leucobacter TaxID=2621730 RepID=UPI00165DC3AA|nr:MULTISPECIES: DoxX family membrane protein [unclassified Leucobacter]MBC9935972.1 DoxX family membrane protein [Leucobacter sp. cx-87]